jgi:bacteriocin-like protein
MISNLDNLNAEYQELSDNELETVVGGTGTKGRTGCNTPATSHVNVIIPNCNGGNGHGHGNGGRGNGNCNG